MRFRFEQAIGLAATAFVLAAGASFADSSQPLPKQLTITITDSGFDQPFYTVGTSPGTPADIGVITVINKGSDVHTATRAPGSTFKVGFGSVNYLAGQTTNLVDFDSGGLSPGQSIMYGVPYPGTYQLTSATDCLNGNHSSRFNCGLVSVQVLAVPPGGGAAPGQAGSAVSPSADCARTVLVAGGTPTCISQDRLPGQTVGTPAQGAGDTTVTIDDVSGFQPSLIYLKAGSTLTWTNKGQKFHSVKQKLGTGAPDGFHQLDSGAMQPGGSYSYTFACPPGPVSALSGLTLSSCSEMVGPFGYLSNIGDDAIGPSADGFGTTTAASGSNSSLFVGSVFLVP